MCAYASTYFLLIEHEHAFGEVHIQIRYSLYFIQNFFKFMKKFIHNVLHFVKYWTLIMKSSDYI